MKADPNLIEFFLDTLHPLTFEGGLWVSIFDRGSRSAAFFNNLPEAVDHVASLAEHVDMYCGLGGLLAPPDHGRGSTEAVVILPGFFADIDIEHAAHGNAKAKPVDEQAALEILVTAGVCPSLLIHSGHGYHAFWLLDTPLICTNSEERQQMIELSRGWSRYLLGVGAGLGYELDPVGDVARVVRIPGTINHKQAEQPRPVRLVLPSRPGEEVPRYRVDELAERIPPATAAVDLSPRAVDLDDDAPPRLRLRQMCLLDEARHAANGAKFQVLFDEGDISGYPSPSEADLALCSMLAFWTGNCARSIDYYFRQSALCRPKWLTRADYPQQTIARAIALNQSSPFQARNK